MIDMNILTVTYPNRIVLHSHHLQLRSLKVSVEFSRHMSPQKTRSVEQPRGLAHAFWKTESEVPFSIAE